VTQSWQNASSAITNTKTQSSSSEQNIDMYLSPSASNQAADTDFSLASMKSLYVLATGGNVTLKTNSATTPGDTITLVDGIPLVWITGGSASNPFQAAVSTYFLTNISTTSTVLFQQRLLKDATA